MTYCFDLDGTLCYTNGMDYLSATPNWRMIERVNRLYDGGNRIVIDTARGSGTGDDWTHRTEQQIQSWGLQYHELRCGVKFPADVYVDDRAYNARDW